MNIVVLTGAGASADSGISTFRDNDGLWENHPVEKVATPEGFEQNPELVLEFYNQRRAQLLSGEVHPNRGHIALADFEKEFSGKFTLITQNVDNLHERAGSKNIIHMHGELLKMRCIVTENIYDIEGPFYVTTPCPCCHKEGNLRPHIVWFGEVPFQMPEIQVALHNCDLFISIGTSGSVYPAAMLVQIAKNISGARTVEINLDKTENNQFFDEHYQGKSKDKVPEFLAKLREEINE